MKNSKIILQNVARILNADVSLFRKIILDSGGGELPSTIKEKEKILREIEVLLNTQKKSHSLR